MVVKPTNPFRDELPSILGDDYKGSPTLPQQKAKNPNDNLIHMANELKYEMSEEIENVQGKYIPAIKEALARSDWHKAKAEELGTVLKFPNEFFIRQSESIEKFKKTGEY